MTKILLIEDNKDVCENTADILELSNYEVATAANGKVGIDKVREIKPDLILCDIMMPVMDGYEVLEELSKNHETAKIPFIFLTAKVDKSDLRKGMNLGAADDGNQCRCASRRMKGLGGVHDGDGRGNGNGGRQPELAGQ